MSKFKLVLSIVEKSIKSGKKISEICAEIGESSSMVSKYMYDIKNERTILAPHLRERLLILYKHAQSAETITTDDLLMEKAKKYLAKNANKAFTVEDVANHLDISPAKALSRLAILRNDGYSINVKDTPETTIVVQPEESPTLSLGESHLFGALGDTHLCSKYQRLDLLQHTYKRFQELGVKQVFHTGNWVDGEARFNFTDLLVHGMDNQLDYMIEHYPQVEGITTYFISGDDHESWWQTKLGVNVGKYLEIKAQRAGRHDLVFLGHMEADVMLGKTKIRVLHPGGGSAYAISYTSQKIVESYNEDEKPDILLHGHYHKFEYLYLRGIHVFQTGCLQDQTPFMRKKRLSAHLGAWIIDFTPNEDGRVIEMVQRPLTYPRGYAWAYKN